MSPYAKNLVGLGVAALVAGALALVALYGVQKPDEEKARLKEDQERLFTAHAPGERLADGGTPQAGTFDSLVVEAKGERTELSRGADAGWELTSPVKAPADRFAVDSLTSQLQTARIKATVEETPSAEDLTKYGLDNPRFKVTAKAGERTVTFEGGGENPFDGSIYLRKGGSPAVLQAEGGLRWALEKTPFDLREKAVIGLDEATLASLAVKTRTKSYSLVRDEKGQWQLEAPGQPRSLADAPTVSTMLSTFNGERATAFPPLPADGGRALGFDKPEVDVVATLKADAGGGRVRVRLVAARGDAGAGAYMLRESDGAPLFAELPSTALSALERSLDELRDKSLLRFERDGVTAVRVSAQGQPTIELRRVTGADAGTSDAWELVQPEKAPAKSSQVSSLLWALSSAKLTSRGEVAPKSWARYGLEKPSRRFELLGADGRLLGELAIGGDVTGKEGTVYARSSQEPAVLEIGAAQLSTVPSQVSEFRERPLAGDSTLDGGSTTSGG